MAESNTITKPDLDYDFIEEENQIKLKRKEYEKVFLDLDCDFVEEEKQVEFKRIEYEKALKLLKNKKEIKEENKKAKEKIEQVKIQFPNCSERQYCYILAVELIKLEKKYEELQKQTPMIITTHKSQPQPQPQPQRVISIVSHKKTIKQ